MIRSLFYAGVALFMLFPTLPSFAKGQCDSMALFNEAFVTIRTGGRPGPVSELLEQALECPGGETSYLVNFSLAITKLRTGDIEDARALADQARLVSTGIEAEAATSLINLIDRELSLVQFRLQVDPQARVALKLEDDAEILSSIDGITAVVPKQMSRFVSTIWEDIFEEAQLNAKDGIHPLDVWLPTGRYALNTGQIIEVKGGGTQLILVENVYDWSDHSLRVGPAYMAIMPISPETAGSAHNGLMGFNIQGTQRLRSRLLLRASLGIFPTAVYDEPPYEPSTDYELEETDPCLDNYLGFEISDNDGVATLAHSECGIGSKSYVLGLGLGWPVEIKQRMHLIVELDVQATSIFGLTTPVYPDGKDTPDAFYAVNWGGLIPSLGLELFRQVGGDDGLDGGLYFGVVTGAAPGGFTNLNSGSEGGADLFDLSFSQRWIATFTASGGYHLRF